MVSMTSILAMVAAVATFVDHVQAHGYIAKPAPTWKDSTNSEWVVEIPPVWKGDWSGGDLFAMFQELAVTNNFKDVRTLMDGNPVFGDECGHTDPKGKPQDPPTDGTATFSRGMIHAGPCEIWLGGAKVLHNDNCEKAYGDGTVGKASVFSPIDYSSCAPGGCMLRFYWLAIQRLGDNTVWQAYKNCIPLTGPAGGGSSQNSPSSTPSDGDSNKTPSNDGGSNQTPSNGGENKTPSDGDSNKTPAKEYSFQPPSNGGNNKTPSDKGSNPTPSKEYSFQTPSPTNDNFSPEPSKEDNHRTSGSEQKSDDKKSDSEQKSDDKKSDSEQKSDDKKSDSEQKAGDKKSDSEQKAGDKKLDPEQKSDDKKSDSEQKSDGKNSKTPDSEQKSDDKKSDSEQKSDGKDSKTPDSDEKAKGENSQNSDSGKNSGGENSQTSRSKGDDSKRLLSDAFSSRRRLFAADSKIRPGGDSPMMMPASSNKYNGRRRRRY